MSGGADSVFLLHALVDLGLAVAVLHVNHKLRGEDSDRDEEFVREVAARFELPIHVAARPVLKGTSSRRRARLDMRSSRQRLPKDAARRSRRVIQKTIRLKPSSDVSCAGPELPG